MTGVVAISVIPRRMLTKAEAAAYCARPVKRFINECEVAPVRFANGDQRWDMRDLDRWIDSLKSGADDTAAILSRLG